MKNKKISELTAIEIEDRILSLLMMPDAKVIEYLEHVLDNEYTFSEIPEDIKAAELFLADKRFNKYREIMYNSIKDEEGDIIFTFGKRYKSIPRKLRKKRKKEKEKLKKLNKKLVK